MIDESLPLKDRIEALLYTEGGTVTYKRLASVLGLDVEAVKLGCKQLAEAKQSSPLRILMTDSEVSMVVSPEAAQTIEQAFDKDIGTEVGDAGLEVLAIILYRGPSTRAQIDYIRGVNTSSTIRTLTSRGLLERITSPSDGREYLYRPTTELYAHLGIRDARDLPDYATIVSELATFEEQPSSPFNSSHAGATGDTSTAG